jgi:hypothetical protein
MTDEQLQKLIDHKVAEATAPLEKLPTVAF